MCPNLIRRIQVRMGGGGVCRELIFKLRSEEQSTIKGKAVWQKQTVSIAEDPKKNEFVIFKGQNVG